MTADERGGEGSLEFIEPYGGGGKSGKFPRDTTKKTVTQPSPPFPPSSPPPPLLGDKL